MANWRWFAVAAAAVVLALVVMSAMAPDSGPAVAPPSTPAPRATTAGSPPPPPPTRTVRLGAADDHQDGDLSPDDGFDEAAAGLTRLPEPPKPPDPNQVFTADLQGLAGAAVSRREGLVKCIHSYQDATGDQGYDGRFTIKITVSPDGDRGAVSTDVVNGPDDAELYQCLDRVMGDAKFEAPDHPTSVMWPIPLVTPTDY